MPIELTTNRLLTWGIGLFTSYWAFGFLADPLWYSAFVSACLLVGGVMVAFRAVPDAVKIVYKGSIGPGEMAIIGLALISMGAVWTGTFNIIFSIYERPQDWIGPVSSFGRAAIATGFFVLFLSPDATRQGVKLPRWYVLIGGALIIALMSFLLGYNWGGKYGPISSMFDTTRAIRDVTLMSVMRA